MYSMSSQSSGRGLSRGFCRVSEVCEELWPPISGFVVKVMLSFWWGFGGRLRIGIAKRTMMMVPATHRGSKRSFRVPSPIIEERLWKRSTVESQIVVPFQNSHKITIHLFLSHRTSFLFRDGGQSDSRFWTRTTTVDNAERDQSIREPLLTTEGIEKAKNILENYQFLNKPALILTSPLQ